MILQLVHKIKKSLLNSSKVHLGNYVVGKVNRKKELYQLHYPNNLSDLKRILLPGDVLLVEGEYGLSDWIKVFSSHTWSHCALYIGEQSPYLPSQQDGPLEPKSNLVEAIIGRGVLLSSLDKYQNCNLRVCRPRGLSRRQKERVIQFALSKVGLPYDQENILQFVGLPFHERGKPTDNIGDAKNGKYTCSSLIAQAFKEVGLEILHYYDKEANRLVAYHPSQIQPKDFDLSPNFEILKIYPSTLRRPFGLFRSFFLKQKSA